MRIVGLALALLAAGCVPILASPNISPQWLEGRWTHDSRNCSSIGTIDYEAQGTYNSHDEGGAWRLDGNRITEVADFVRGDFDGRLAGRSSTTRIYRTGPNSMLRIFEDGRWVQFSRCPRSR